MKARKTNLDQTVSANTGSDAGPDRELKPNASACDCSMANGCLCSRHVGETEDHCAKAKRLEQGFWCRIGSGFRIPNGRDFYLDGPRSARGPGPSRRKGSVFRWALYRVVV